jgi:Holliday junction DNA helicase RuvB
MKQKGFYMASEFGFRPCKIEDLKGQPKVQKMLRIYIKAAQIKKESFPHTIITGQSGCGKTATANVIAHELGYGFKAFSGPAINDKKVIDEILLNLKENDVLFIDEIHRISQRLQESLYFAMEQFQADVVVDGVATRVSLPHFTLIAATNLYGGLNDALLNRFPIQIKLAAYSKTDMASIVEKICQEKKIKIDEESIYKIAATTRGIPRNANSYVARVYDFALVMNDGVINPEIVDEALYVMGINKFDDMDYMNFLNSNTHAVGVDTICLTLGMDKDTVQTKIEPYLLSKGYIQKQPRGRVITDLGRSMMEECE